MKKSKKAIRKEIKEEVPPPKKEGMTKDVSLKLDEFTQLYEGVDVTECINPQTQQLNIKKLIKTLQKSYNLSFLNKEVKYFLEEGQLWLSCPKLKMNIPQADYEPSPIIKLAALTGREYIDAVMDQSNSESESESNSVEEFEGDQKCRRLKERKIKHVIEKVLRWRQLYAGVGSREKVPLEEGARMVNISKKTLDDYLSQIKKGKKYGFNFNEHKNEKVGVLREFIRKVEKAKK